MNYLPQDLSYLCLFFLDWEEYHTVCEELGMDLKLDIYFKKYGNCEEEIKNQDIPIDKNIKYLICNYLHKHYFINFVVVHIQQFVAKKEYFEILEYLGNNYDIMWTEYMPASSELGHFKTVKYIYEKTYDNNNKYRELRHNKPDYNKLKYNESMYEAAKNGHLNIVKYLHSNNIKLTTKLVHHASRKGHLNIIKYLHENNVRLTKKSLNSACKHGHYKIVKYLYKNGVRTGEHAIKNACKNGHLKIIKYLHRHGEKYSYLGLDRACKNGNLEVVEFLHKIGAKFTEHHLLTAIEFDKRSIVNFLCWLEVAHSPNVILQLMMY